MESTEERYDNKKNLAPNLIRKLEDQPLGMANSGAHKQLHDTTQEWS